MDTELMPMAINSVSAQSRTQTARTDSTYTGNMNINIKDEEDQFGLDFEDFLQLMVQQLQNQTMDNTADTGEMLNQMVQMSTVQVLSSVKESMQTMVDANMLTYAASLVGKEVTVGQYDEKGNLTQIVGQVTGTGTYQGLPVIFVNGKQYYLYEIMAIGKIPEGLLDVQVTPPITATPTEDQAPGDGVKGKYTYNMEGLAFDRTGTVIVTLGGQEYEVSVTADMTKEKFTEALEKVYNKNPLSDPAGGKLEFTNNGDGTFTLEAAKEGAWSALTLAGQAINIKSKSTDTDSGEDGGEGETTTQRI
mgnify:FL=1